MTCAMWANHNSQLITDLKKENFDLKLRLYHLEDIMTKDLDLYQLKQQVLKADGQRKAKYANNNT